MGSDIPYYVLFIFLTLVVLGLVLMWASALFGCLT